MAEIQFGEMEYQGPRGASRPDEDAHYCVVMCGDLGDHDLPIFVDLDVIRDMEAHARTDTDVELGGVMLGGQFVDSDGQPFVVVSDNLRAEHFQATRGSFKFTHETWQEITRRRAEFSDELQMVGWYHTHPDWGVFLSGMDTFICDNFFNRDLDVALVIDPCRDERGWFQWTESHPRTTRRTGGFYLFANRFRQAELELFQSIYSGESGMPSDPRYSEMGGSVVQPVVNINDQRTPVQNIAIMAMLTVQVLLLGLLSYFVIVGLPLEDDQSLARMESQVAVLDQTERLRAREEAFEQTIAVLAGDEATANVASRLMDLQAQRRADQLNLEGQMALTEAARLELQRAEEKNFAQAAQIELLGKQRREAERKIGQLESYKRREEADEQFFSWRSWPPYVVGTALVLAGLGGGYWLGSRGIFGSGFEGDAEVFRDEHGGGPEAGQTSANEYRIDARLDR